MTVNREILDGMTVFVQVVECGGFTAAAKAMGNSTSFISKEVSRLEDRLGVRLLNRTTRTISPTDIGRLYFERCQQIIADAEETERSIFHLHDNPQGTLKVSAPISMSRCYLLDVLPQFLQTYPDIQLEIDLNDRFVDIVSEGFDVVIRGGILNDSNLISRKILSARGVLVASPDYLKRKGRPTHPSEIIHHDCIGYAYKAVSDYWEFIDEKGNPLNIKITSRVICNNAEMEEAFVKSGIGICMLPTFACEQALAEGSVVEILGDYMKRQINVYAIYPHRQHLSAKVRVFVDFLADHFSKIQDQP